MAESHRIQIYEKDGLERDWSWDLDPGWNPLGFGVFDAWPHLYFLFDASNRPFFTYHLGPLSHSKLSYPNDTRLFIRTPEDGLLLS